MSYLFRVLQFLIFVLLSLMYSCEGTSTISTNTQESNQSDVNTKKFIEFAEAHFAESYSDSSIAMMEKFMGTEVTTIGVENIRIDTVLILSSYQAERIRAYKFERDFKLNCQLDSVEYSEQVEQDSLSRWLRRIEESSLSKVDTVGYEVKFLIDYVNKNGSRNHGCSWIHPFYKDFTPAEELTGPLLEEYKFLVKGADC